MRKVKGMENQEDIKLQDEKKQEKKQEKERHWFDWFLLLIIVILIIIILWLLCRLRGYLNVRPVISNGDIFEIHCECNQTIIDNGSSSDIPSDDDSSLSERPSEGEVIIGDNDGVWDVTEQLRIFQNPMYQMEEIIAPGSSNSYQFYVRNNTGCQVEYELSFIETNPYAVNMKYKLKINNTDITKDWVSITELSQYKGQLASASEDVYYLEWKWIEAENDTDVGANIEAFYQLKIQMNGQQIGG